MKIKKKVLILFPVLQDGLFSLQLLPFENYQEEILFVFFFFFLTQNGILLNDSNTDFFVFFVVVKVLVALVFVHFLHKNSFFL